MKKVKKVEKKAVVASTAKKAAPMKPVALKTMSMKAAPAKSSKKAEPKVKLALEKSDKKSSKLEVKATEVLATSSEDDEDEAELTSGRSSAKASAEAGLAAASASATADATAGSLKNFRHHPDIENYYRFIYENDLRYEALEIIDVIVAQRETRKQIKVARSKAH